MIINKNYNRCAYFEDDEERDCSATRILRSGGINKIEFTNNEILLWIKSETHMNFTYIVCVYPIEKAACQCPDFLTRGIACKHLRAAILYINWMRQQPNNSHLPEIKLPTQKEIQEEILISKFYFLYLFLLLLFIYLIIN